MSKRANSPGQGGEPGGDDRDEHEGAESLLADPTGGEHSEQYAEYQGRAVADVAFVGGSAFAKEWSTTPSSVSRR